MYLSLNLLIFIPIAFKEVINHLQVNLAARPSNLTEDINTYSERIVLPWECRNERISDAEAEGQTLDCSEFTQVTPLSRFCFPWKYTYTHTPLPDTPSLSHTHTPPWHPISHTHTHTHTHTPLPHTPSYTSTVYFTNNGPQMLVLKLTQWALLLRLTSTTLSVWSNNTGPLKRIKMSQVKILLSTLSNHCQKFVAHSLPLIKLCLLYSAI